MSEETEHACTGCIYHYKYEEQEPVVRYNALADTFMKFPIAQSKDGCGSTPGGIALDEKQPKCPAYVTEEEMEERIAAEAAEKGEPEVDG